VYSPDIVYFDVVPPLRYVGSAALRERFTRWFDGFDGPLDMDIHDLRIQETVDMAVAYWLNRIRATLKSGPRIGSWVRATSCCQRSPDGWLVIHEHISLPVEPADGRAAADLTP
jgi:ketosteroid isomerase-like protein